MAVPLRLLAALLVLPLAGCSLIGPGSSDAGGPASPTPKPSPTTTPVPGALEPAFFGMHDSKPLGASWPKGAVGSLRIWDAGVAWNQVETTPGRYDFGRLDAIVRAARKHQAQSLIVLGQTPVFHSLRPQRTGAYGPGASSMPDLAAWTAYVRAIVKRYHAPDVTFQVWNESNVEGYWSGTYQQMAQLTAAARAVVDSVTPRPLLVAPAMAVRTLGERVGLQKLYAQKVAGVPVGDMVDVVSLQLYPEPDLGPARSSELLVAARGILDRDGVPADKPVWDTEINFGLRGGLPATPATVEQQQAKVAMTYLIDASAGVGRVFWYAWDLHAIADTDLVGADNVTPTAAGRAFDEVQRWMIGSKVESCTDAGHAWVCVIRAPEGERRVYWSPNGSATVRTAFDATTTQTLAGPVQALPLGGTTLQVGWLPVMVTSGSGVSPAPPRL
jgi:hypothetical protein